MCINILTMYTHVYMCDMLKLPWPGCLCYVLCYSPLYACLPSFCLPFLCLSQ